MSEPVTGSTTYNYNPVPVTPTLGAGMLGSIVNSGSLGYTLSYRYDALGRVTQISSDACLNTPPLGNLS
jgi:hypothetical protein